LREYLGVKSSETEFPHENKGADAQQFLLELFDDTEYKKQYTKELSEYLKKFGLEVTAMK